MAKKLQNLWPKQDAITKEYIAGRRDSDDAFMAKNKITNLSHIEYDLGLVDGNYVSEWKIK